MPKLPIQREIAFTIMDVARILRTYADQLARQFSISRAQWGVLVRLDRSEGLKQSELAEILDLQPISLTRLLDGLEPTSNERLLHDLGLVKDNLRAAIARNATQQNAANG